MTVDRTGPRSADQLEVDHRPPPVDLGDIQADLYALASELRASWPSALERGDFDEVTRLVEASHADHRAVLALTADSLAPVRRS